jgi:hypothetical protein
MRLVISILILLCSNTVFAQSEQDSSVINFLYQLQNDGDDLVLARISYHSEIKCEACLKSVYSSKVKAKGIEKLSDFQRTQILASLKKITNKNLILTKKDCITPYEERQALYILHKETLYSFVYIPCEGLNFTDMLRGNEQLIRYFKILLVL